MKAFVFDPLLKSIFEDDWRLGLFVVFSVVYFFGMFIVPWYVEEHKQKGPIWTFLFYFFTLPMNIVCSIGWLLFAGAYYIGIGITKLFKGITFGIKYIVTHKRNITRHFLQTILTIGLIVGITLFAESIIEEYQHRQNAIYMNITAHAVCVKNNSVGSSWDIDYTLNGTESPDAEWFGKVWQKSKITVETTVTELDSIDDIGKKKTTYRVTERDLRYGFEIEQTVIVRENRGRYSGNTAEWKIVYTFEP